MELIDRVRSIKPQRARGLEKKKENYLAFTKYPKEGRKYIYTTNVVESINAGLELMRMEFGG